MIKDGLGGANTRTGLVFEGKTDLATFLNSQQSYKVNNQNEVFYNDDLVGQIFKKHAFYKFLESRSIKWQDYISKRLLPDDSIYVIINNNYVFSEDFTNKAREILNQDIDFKSVYLVITTKLQELHERINKEFMNNSNINIQDEEEKNNEIQNNKENNSENNNIEENISEDSVDNLSQMEQDANYIKSTIDFIKPIEGKITSGFGMRNPTTASVPKNHKGTDIAAETGTKILAATEGKVILSSTSGDYGKHLKIQTSDNDVVLVYAHCNNLYVKEGENIKQGQEIAEVGATGNATGPHLHFEVLYQSRYVDPQMILEL